MGRAAGSDMPESPEQDDSRGGFEPMLDRSLGDDRTRHLRKDDISKLLELFADTEITKKEEYPTRKSTHFHPLQAGELGDDAALGKIMKSLVKTSDEDSHYKEDRAYVGGPKGTTRRQAHLLMMSRGVDEHESF